VNLILVMQSRDNLSDASFMVEPRRMVCFTTFLSAANVIAVPKAVDAEAVDKVFKVPTGEIVACADIATAAAPLKSGTVSGTE